METVVNRKDAALRYAALGISIIPVGQDKKPLMKWEQYQKKRATEKEIESWWARWPEANIAMVTGSISGAMAVDCDTAEGIETFEKFLPETLETPIQTTPRGGRHYMFQHEEGIRNNARIRAGIDTRGEGGYVLLSPSGNGNGHSYVWIPGMALGETPLARLPDAYKKILIDSANTNTYGVTRESPVEKKDNAEGEKTEFFTQGRRNEDLFHAANALIKGGGGEDFTGQVVRMLAMSCTPAFSEQEAAQTVLSALQRAGRKERNVTQELRDWVQESGGGQFRLSDYQRENGVLSKQDRHASVVACKRLTDQGVLERVGQRTGEYRIRDTSVEFMDFVNVTSSQRIDLTLPLGIHKKTIFFPKSVVVVAGVTGHGKTTFLLNVIKDNMHRLRFRYFASEMSPQAINYKLSKFDIPINSWKMDVIPDSNWDYNNIHDKIFPNDINVVDYLEPEGERSYTIHAIITKIIEKLDQGLCLISTQKKPGADLSAGGVYSAKACSLYLSLDWGKVFIFKNRFMEEDPQPTLTRHNFTIASGQKIESDGNGWYHLKDFKRSKALDDFPREV